MGLRFSKDRILKLVCLILLISVNNVQAASVGWSFNFDSSTVLTSQQSAGFPPFQQTNWNNSSQTGQVPSGSETSLIDSSGTTTNVDLSWSIVGESNNWHMSTSGSPDAKINNGFLARDATVILSNIPYACYSAIIYYNNNEVNGDSIIEIYSNGALTSSREVLSGTANVSTEISTVNDYIEETGVGQPSPSNVTVFNGLQAATLEVRFLGVMNANLNTGPTAVQIFESDAIFANGFESGTTPSCL